MTYDCFYCQQPLIKGFSKFLTSRIWNCKQCNCVYETDRQSNLVCFSIYVSLKENKFELIMYHHLAYLNLASPLYKLIKKFDIENISNITPKNLPQKIKTLLLFQ